MPYYSGCFDHCAANQNRDMGCELVIHKCYEKSSILKELIRHALMKLPLINRRILPSHEQFLLLKNPQSCEDRMLCGWNRERFFVFQENIDPEWVREKPQASRTTGCLHRCKTLAKRWIQKHNSVSMGPKFDRGLKALLDVRPVVQILWSQPPSRKWSKTIAENGRKR